MTRRRVAAGLTCAGLALMVVGTFLPWVRSGSVGRSSYSATGLLRRLLDASGALAFALDAWAFLGLAAALAVVAVVAGFRRTGAGLAALLALVTGAVAVATFRAPGGGEIAADRVGPTVALVGGAISLIGAMLLLTSRENYVPPYGS